MQLLQASGMVLLNGRAPGDPTGASTFTSPANGGTSVVDVACVSASLYEQVTSCTVIPFVHLAPGHACITIALRLQHATPLPRRQARKVHRPNVAALSSATELATAIL